MSHANSASIFATYLLIFVIFMTFFNIEAAKYCYSGQNSGYKSKQCSQGGTNVEFTCQKFVCEGGRSPFVSRYCSVPMETQNPCEASSRMCLENIGNGTCFTCTNDLCNHAISYMSMFNFEYYIIFVILYTIV
uniref:Uncharacterized protein n=1 Tax=Acrobeloides nanus TaxID=290746 RepID=A0A914CX19_9BILA